MTQRTLTVLSMSLILAGCGGSSSSSDEEFFAQCSPYNEKQQLVENLRRDYLWNNELPSSIDLDNYNNVFDLLPDIISPRDRFSFIITEQEYEDIFLNATLFGLGFGRQDDLENGVIRVRYVYDDSPADRAGITRGSEITHVNNIPMSEWYTRLRAGTASWEDVFGPDQEDTEVAVEWRRVDGSVDNAVLLKTTVQTNTVMAAQRFDHAGSDVGYFVFDSFIDRSEQDVNNAFDQFQDIDELVIDLRYNGGGLIRVANQIASQTAWHKVENETFVTYQFNSNYRDQPVLFNLGRGIEQLNLDRVFVLTTGATCSSSELIINSLEPFVEVVTIGQPTCGKPFGQQPTEICENILFAVNFQTVNAEGDGDYIDGIMPTCRATDTVRTDWGDSNDPLLGTALEYLTHGSCPAPASMHSSIGLATHNLSPGINLKDTQVHLPPFSQLEQPPALQPQINPILLKQSEQH